ncbi:hypothetical protein JOD82_001896 [Paenibacillus sp. 1182]|uniref:hypothetical protein n=1 Tax=Paenibacillus sp. 1182 TaxID=2806565 RepID=UPI001AE455D7|nr:hypothetical protein [Paenibacillus sp. 1182]MBP1308876.1 hypothetical protein [Paenibacillus sp. 1182]
MRKMSPEEAAKVIALENHITVVFEEGFEEESRTANEFRDLLGQIQFERACIHALLGGQYRYETFLKQDKFERNSILDIVRFGDWSYIILHDQKHPTDEKLYVIIQNVDKANEETEDDSAPQYEETSLKLNHQESYTVLSMVGDCIERGQVAEEYEIKQLENLLEIIDDPFEGFKDDLEFEIQIKVKKKLNKERNTES